MRLKLAYTTALLLVLQAPTPARAQWTNRYPKLANTSHHVYLEGYNLPTFSNSPTDPAVSPDGKTVAFAARGWLWTMDIATRRARRLTHGKDVDARPAWSPDGSQIAFVRDNSSDTTIMAVDVASGRERVLVDTKGMDLDPVFSPDGKTLFYSSAEAGDLDIWRMDLASGTKTRLTTDRGQELNPQPIGGGTAIAFVAKGRGDSVQTLSLANNERRTLLSDSLIPQLRISASPDGHAVAAITLNGDRWKLVVLDAKGGDTIQLAPDAPAPEAPAWSSKGDIWFVQPTADIRFDLYRVAETGGPIEKLTPLEWNLGEATAKVTIRTREGGKAVAARLAVVDGAGHPAAPDGGMVRFDGQSGRIFFHSPGTVTLQVPAGTLRVIGTHGFDGVGEVTRAVHAGEEVAIDLDLPTTGFDAAARGWYSGDLHSHLNYGGPFQLVPDDMVNEMRGENLDVATPMLANLQTTLVDSKWAGWQRTTPPLMRMSQEVRSHFLGHVGVVGADQLYTPWFFGPGYPVYGQIDLRNGDPLEFTRAHGGLNVYVHPVMRPGPFPADGPPRGIPTELVADAVLGDVDAIEVANVWSDELGTSDVWYRLLNLGLPIVPTGGSDTMHNFHRMVAIGATRVYARPDGPLNMTSFLDAVRKGRSFVTTGPMIEFKVGGVGPGGVVAGGSQSVEWTLDAWSPTAVQNVEVLVNGRLAWRGAGLTAPGKKSYSGKITVPKGGWVAARVYGGPSVWPTQDSYPFAHTAPVWLGRVGSSDPETVRVAAGELLRALDVAETRMTESYPGDAGGRLKQRFEAAKVRLTGAKDQGSLTR